MKPIQPILIKLALLLAILCLGGLLSSGLGVRFGLWDFRVGFNVLKWSAYLVGVPVALAVIAAVMAKISGASLLNYRYAVVLIIGLFVFGVPYMSVKEFRKMSTIADATTSFDDPPVFVDLVAVRNETSSNPLEYRAGDAIERQKQYFPDLTTLELDKSPKEVIDQAAEIAAELGLEIAAVKPEEGRLEATETTFWFRFKDDVVVRAQTMENGMTQVDIRSASRVGYGDGGINAKRVQHFIKELSKG